VADTDVADRFYLRWVLANGWSAAVGLGTTMVIGRFVVSRLPLPTGRVGLLIDVAAAIALGALLEGAIVGAAQERVLRARLVLPRYRWTLATVIGAAVAWMLGMVPSTIMAFIDKPPGIAPDDFSV
jgi:hypothetical protein